MAKKSENSEAFQILKDDLRNKTTKPLYVFYGEEIYLLQYYLTQLKKQKIDELTESFNFHKLTAETFDLQAFSDAVENLPMMAEHTMVQVDEIDLFKLNEADRNRMTELLADIPEYCTVVFTYNTTPWNPDKRYKKLWDAVSTYAQIVEFAKQEPRDLVAWITRHFQAKKKQIPTSLCQYLIDITDGTMTSLSCEIEKICAFSGADVICKADIDAVTEPVLDVVAFQMTDLLARGDFSAALESLQKLLKMQQEPLTILGAIGSHLRKMSAAKVLTDHGRGADELAKLYGISDYAARKNMDLARKFQPSFYKKAANLVLETDYAMKTSFDDADRLLELLILQLAQEARNA